MEKHQEEVPVDIHTRYYVVSENQLLPVVGAA
jgi:hypothetical protein